MSDEDRITNYIRNQERDVRRLPDGCGMCNASGLSCRAQRYFNGAGATCCPTCTHVGD